MIIHSRRIVMPLIAKDGSDLGRTAVPLIAVTGSVRSPIKSVLASRSQDQNRFLEIWIAAGPTMTTNRPGKMQKSSGNRSLTGVLAARSSAY